MSPALKGPPPWRSTPLGLGGRADSTIRRLKPAAIHGSPLRGGAEGALPCVRSQKPNLDKFGTMPAPAYAWNPPLKCKQRLKINAPIGGLGGASTAPATTEEPTQRVRLAEQGRADHSDARPKVYIIEKIPGVGAEREVEASIGGGSWSEEAARPTASTQTARAKTAASATPAAAATTTSTTARTASKAATRGGPSLRFFPEAKGLAQPKVERELAGILEVIGGNDGLEVRRSSIEHPERSTHDVGGGTRRARCGECRPRIERAGPK